MNNLLANQTEINGTNIPSNSKFNMENAELINAEQYNLKKAFCIFSYIYSNKKKMAIASLNAFEYFPVNITLEQIESVKTLRFESKTEPVTFVVQSKIITIKKVILEIDLITNQRKATIIFQKDFTANLLINQHQQSFGNNARF